MVYDISGKVLAEYKSENLGTINLSKQYVYAGSRITTLNITPQLPQQNFVNPVYEISDHTASIRATFDKDENGTCVTILHDYYPFGWEMPDANTPTTKYKYAYQGQICEKRKH